MSLDDFKEQKPSVAAGQVNTGQTTGGVELRAASATQTNRVWLDWLTLGAAGSVVVKAGGSNVSQQFLFPAKGSLYVGMLFEGTVNTALSINATLDAAAAANVPVEATFRYDVR